MDLKKVTALLLSLSLTAGLCACGQDASGTEVAVADAEEKAYIEETLNLANNADLHGLTARTPTHGSCLSFRQ